MTQTKPRESRDARARRLEQEKLAARLWGPIDTTETPEQTRNRLFQTIAILEQQRDEALAELNDRANIEGTLAKLQHARQVIVETAESLIRTGRAMKQKAARV